MLDVSSAIKDRRSVRAFTEQVVAKELIQEILETAKFAPSGVNTQPWQVAVVKGAVKEKISADFTQAFRNGRKPDPDFQYYPTEWIEPFKSRRFACGMALYGALEIDRADKARRQQQWELNYHFFNAPVGLFFYLDAHLEKGSWLDTGMFIQSVMLAARGVGLESCPQAALSEYPDIVRQHLQLAKDQHIVCGMALGYADWDHPVNQYRTDRAALDAFTTWFWD